MKIILSFLFILTSCSTLFKSVSYAPENEYPKASADKAMVYFMRSESYAGSAAKWIVTESRNRAPAKNIGIFTSGSYFFKQFEPGEVVFEVVDPGWGSSLGYKKLTLQPGKTYFLELKTGSDGFGSQSHQRSGLVINDSINLRNHLEDMRMVDLEASRESWKN